jgi:hypothetical protein
MPLLKRQSRSSRQRRTNQLATPEALETRRLLTGRVKVALVGNDLVIRGDARDNTIVVDLSADNPEDIFQGEDGTRVRFDGQLRRAARRGELPRIDDIRVRMRAGNDTVIVFAGDFTAPDDVRVDMGYGRDTFVMVGDPDDPAFVNDSFSIRTRGKESVIGLANVEVRNNLKIKTGNSQDVIGVSGIEVGGRTTIATRRGADGVVAIDSVFGGTTKVSLGRGDDILGAINSEVDGTLDVNGSDGTDRVLVDADSDAGDIERSSIALVDSLNDLPNDVLEEVEDRLEDLADDAEDLLPSRISDIFVDEIEALLGQLEREEDEEEDEGNNSLSGLPDNDRKGRQSDMFDGSGASRADTTATITDSTSVTLSGYVGDQDFGADDTVDAIELNIQVSGRLTVTLSNLRYDHNLALRGNFGGDVINRDDGVFTKSVSLDVVAGNVVNVVTTLDGLGLGVGLPNGSTSYTLTIEFSRS